MLTRLFEWMKAPGGFFWKWVLACGIAYLSTGLIDQTKRDYLSLTISSDTMTVLVLLQWLVLRQRLPSISLWWIFGPLVGRFILTLTAQTGWLIQLALKLSQGSTGPANVPLFLIY